MLRQLQKLEETHNDQITKCIICAESTLGSYAVMAETNHITTFICQECMTFMVQESMVFFKTECPICAKASTICAKTSHITTILCRECMESIKKKVVINIAKDVVINIPINFELEFCYELLGLSSGATMDEIKSAYHKMKSLHPDKGGDATYISILKKARDMLLTAGAIRQDIDAKRFWVLKKAKDILLKAIGDL